MKMRKNVPIMKFAAVERSWVAQTVQGHSATQNVKKNQVTVVLSMRKKHGFLAKINAVIATIVQKVENVVKTNANKPKAHAVRKTLAKTFGMRATINAASGGTAERTSYALRTIPASRERPWGSPATGTRNARREPRARMGSAAWRERNAAVRISSAMTVNPAPSIAVIKRSTFVNRPSPRPGYHAARASSAMGRGCVSARKLPG